MSTKINERPLGSWFGLVRFSTERWPVFGSFLLACSLGGCDVNSLEDGSLSDFMTNPDATSEALLRPRLDESDSYQSPLRDVAPDLLMETPSGGSIGFFYDARDNGILLAEKSRAGTSSVLTTAKLNGATPLEIYWGLGGDEVLTPAFLAKNQKDISDTEAHSLALMTPAEARELFLAAESDPQASTCSGSTCFNPGYDLSYCEFDVPYNQTRSWGVLADDVPGWSYAHMQATACNLGASVTVTLRYRTSDCDGPIGNLTSITGGGFPIIDDMEAANYTYFGTSMRAWYLDKNTTTSGSTDLSLKGVYECPEGF